VSLIAVAISLVILVLIKMTIDHKYDKPHVDAGVNNASGGYAVHAFACRQIVWSKFISISFIKRSDSLKFIELMPFYLKKSPLSKKSCKKQLNLKKLQNAAKSKKAVKSS